MEARIDLAIVAGYLAKTEGHPCKRNQREEQENGDSIWVQCGCRWVFKNRAETDNRPNTKDEECRSPKKKGAEITTRAGWRDCLSRVGLARPGTERAGVVARSLLIHDGGSHDVRGSALVALVKIQLRYGCHSVVPDLATVCDTSPFD
jgi:hypothetical protein